MPSTNDVKRLMDGRFANGTAYRSDLPFDILRGYNIRAATKMLCEHMLDPSVRTLDVGSGQGGIVAFWPHRNIVGVEISEVAARMARDAYPDVKFVCCPIENFSLGAGMAPFDLVVAQESIEHWTDVPSGLRAIHQAMRPQATLVLTTPNRDSLHCRMRRKLGRGEAPYCSSDHMHEFGFQELINVVELGGFTLEKSTGVGLLPYWTMENIFGKRIRKLTDADEEVVEWFEDIGRGAPPDLCFIQAHRFRRHT